jgi:hypothetical protein
MYNWSSPLSNLFVLLHNLCMHYRLHLSISQRNTPNSYSELQYVHRFQVNKQCTHTYSYLHHCIFLLRMQNNKRYNYIDNIHRHNC